MADPIIRIKRSSTPGKIPLTSDLVLGELAVNTYDGKAYLKKDVDGTETVVSLGGGYPGQTYYVTKNGLDTNDGQNISGAFATLRKALSVAVSGDTIQIFSGTFTEIFPLTVPQGVTVRGNGIRSTFIQPTSGTERNDTFLLNGETTIEDLSLGNFYYNSSSDTGYGFRFAPNMVTTTRSPYIQRVTVLNRGSSQTANDPYGFDTVDNYPTAKIAGRGALIDASVVQSTTLEPAILFNECTFITPNQTGLKMTNGARTEWVNCFTYFSSIGIDGVTGNTGVAGTANAQLKLSGISTSVSANYVIKYYQSGNPVAIGTVVSVSGDYITILGKGSGIFNSVGIGSTQDVRIFQSNGITQVGTASTILWADYQKFGADMRSIGSASNFGIVGVKGDGVGVQLRLFGFNFGAVGSGKTFTQDPTLTIPQNEAIQLNGGRVYFQSVDQVGNFRVGSLLEIGQETGLFSILSSGNISISGTLSLSKVEVSGISTFNDQINHYNSVFNTNQTNYNLINSNATRLNFIGDGTDILIGAPTGVTTIRNYKFNLSGGQESYTSTTGTLVVTGGAGISSSLNVGKDFKVTGVSTFVSPVRLDSSLRVSGVSTLSSEVQLGSNLNVVGVTTSGNLRVTGVTTLGGSALLNSNLYVSGITTLASPLFATSATLSDSVIINSNLTVSGNVTIGGTTFALTAQELRVKDKEIVLGITTNGSGNDVSTDTSANHGGIAIASTEGNPLVQLTAAGINTLPNTYKQIMWVKGNTMGAGTTDAWLLNYAVGVGSTLVPNGVRLSVGGIQFTDTNITATKITTRDATLSFIDGTNLNYSGISTFNNVRITGISTLSGDVQLENNLRVTGISTFQNTISHNSQLFITNQSTYKFIDTTTTTVTAFGDATSVGIGSTNATLTLRPSTVIGTNSTQNLYNTVAATVNAFGAGTAINIGANTGTITIGNPTLVGTQASQNIYNTVATTVNAFGAGTAINIGANTGTLTIGNPTVVGTQASQNLYNTVATTVNAFGAATSLNLGAATGTATINNATVTLSNATTVNVNGANPTIAGSSTGTLNLFNTNLTSVNAFGAATNILLGATTGVATVRNVTFSLPNATTFAINGVNPTISGTSTGTLTLFNTALTSVNAFGSATAIVLGSTTGIATVRNTTFSLPNATGLAINGANPTISGTSTGTLTLFNTALTSVNAFGDATNIVISATTGITTIRNTLNSGNLVTVNVDVTGLSTFASDIDQNSGTSRLVNLDVIGISTFNDNVIFNNLSTISNGTVQTASLDVVGVATIGSTLYVRGDLQVDGNTTTINSSTLQVDDVNIQLGAVVASSGLTATLVSGQNFVQLNSGTTSGLIPGQLVTKVSGTGSFGTSARIIDIFSSTTFSVSPTHTASGTITFDVGGATDYTADQGGIILFGDTNKRIYWNRSTDTWKSTENIDLDPNKSFRINGSEVLSGSTLSIPNINSSGIVTFQTSNILNSTTFIGTVSNLLNNNIYSSGISSFSQAYITSGIVTSLKVDYFTLTNNETLIVTQNNSIIGPSTDKIAITTTGLRPEMTVYSSGTELLPNTTILSIDAPGVITITPSSINASQTTTSTVTVVDDPRAGVASITKLKAHVGIFTNFDTFNANITGITTTNRLYVNTDIYTPGISSANTITARVGIVTFLSGTHVEYTGVGTINTLRTHIGFVTHLMGTNLWYTGISTLPILNTNVGIVTYLTGTNLDYSGVGTVNTLRTNIGFVTTIYGTDLQLTGVTTVPTLRVNTGFVTTISGTRATYSDIDNTNLYNTGIASFTNLRTNIGIVTYITGTNLNYSGIATVPNLFTNYHYSGISSSGSTYSIDGLYTGTLTLNAVTGNTAGFVNLDVNNFNASGITSIANLNVTNVAITSATGDNFQTTSVNTENLITQRIYSSGITSVSTFFANIGFTTNFNATNGVIGLGTITDLTNTKLYTSGIGTVNTLYSTFVDATYLTGTNIAYSGVGTVNTLRTNVGFVTYLTGTNISYSGVGTVNTLRTNVGFVTFLSGTNLSYSGITTLSIVYASDLTIDNITNSNTISSPIGFVSYVSGRNLDYIGIGTIDTFKSNVGLVTYLTGTNLEYSGIGSIGTLRNNIGVTTYFTATNSYTSGIGTILSFYANSGVVTTLSGTRATYQDIDVTNLFAIGITTIANIISNSGIITYLSGTNSNYSGISTVGFLSATNVNTSGITTINTLLISPNNNLSYLSDGTNLEFNGIGTIRTLRTNTGFVTSISGTNLSYSGIGTISILVNDQINTSGVATVNRLFVNNGAIISGVSTFNQVIADTILTNNLDLSGTGLVFTGVATFFKLSLSDSASIPHLTNTNFTSSGISTLNYVNAVNINALSGVTTVGKLRVGVGGSILIADASSGIGSVGINTTLAKNALHVYGSLQINDNTVYGSVSAALTSAVSTPVHQALARGMFRSVEYTVQASIGNTHQITKILSIHDGITAYNSEYSNISTGIDVATYEVDIDNSIPPGYIRLNVTPVSNTGITTVVVNFIAHKI